MPLIYSTAAILELERLALTQYGLAAETLMQRAGEAAFDFLCKRWPKAMRLAVFAGAGNNGGDGYKVAQLAHAFGQEVTLWQVGDHTRLKDAAQLAHDQCVAAGVNIRPFSKETPIRAADVIVDAITGIGLHFPLREEIVLAIQAISALSLPILALDMPSGVLAETGAIAEVAVAATATITFIGLKLGLLTGKGCSYTGEWICDSLGVPAALLQQVPPLVRLIARDDFSSYLKPRPRYWHKGLSGHVLIVGGDIGFSGAPRMAAEAALRVGAGRVTVATHPHHANTLNMTRPELMCHPIHNAEALCTLMRNADVMVIGPGLGRSAWSQMIWQAQLTQLTQLSMLPRVVDADGLYFLSQDIPAHNIPWVLTPHPKEAAQLLQTTTAAIEADRLRAVIALQKRYGGVCLLKGAGSLICGEGEGPFISDKGNPGMATAGMGDVLSGVIAGLIGQQIPLFAATILGVDLHASAGDLAAKQGERGLVAMDLMASLRQLCNLR